MLSWIALIATIVCSSLGNTFAHWSHSFEGRKRLMVLVLAAGVHGTGLLMFSLALTGLPLAIAYPVLIGGSVACVTLLAVVFFRERIGPRHFGGLALIIAGMLLIQTTGLTSAAPDGPQTAAHTLTGAVK